MLPVRTVITLAILVTGALSSSLFAQPSPDREPRAHRDAMPPVIRVTGEGIVEASPDRATLNVGAVAQAKDASEAQKQVNDIVSKTIQALKDMGIDAKAIQTSGVSLYPVYSNERPIDPARGGESRQPRISGYRAQNRVSVRIDDVSKVGAVIDAAVATGGNTIDGVTFSLKDDASQRREALKQAAAEAKAKADAIAQAMGLTIEGVQEVTESGVNVVYPMMARGMAVASMEAGGAPIEAGQVETRASLTVTYRIQQSTDNAPDTQ